MDAPRRATLAQVATLAGVSLKTASRALGGERYVSTATHHKVMAAAQSLGYQRNVAATMLASGRVTDSVSLIAGDLTNPFYSAVAHGLEDTIHEHGMHLSVGNSRESIDREWELALSVANAYTKAIIVASAMTEHSRYTELQSRGIPIVFVDRPANGLAADSVVLDNRAGGSMAATHLLAHGHQRIGFIGDFEWLPTHRERVAGMADVLDAADVGPWRELVCSGAHDAASAHARADELMNHPTPPTAIIAGNNRITLGVMQAFAAQGRAKDSVALLGFDDFDWAPVLGISVIAHEPEAMGQQAARLALARMADRSREPENVTIPMTLVARGSGELAP